MTTRKYPLGHSSDLSGHLQTYQDVETAEVRKMHDKFDFPRSDVPRLLADHHDLTDRGKMIQEELDEFALAAVSDDLPGMADALIDLVYFAKGTAVMLGLPWGHLWSDVHKCNMAKEPGEKEGREGIKHDLIKPEGWVPPRTLEILKEHGFEEN